MTGGRSINKRLWRGTGSFPLALLFVSRALRHEKRQFAFTIGVCTLAATVACFQYMVFSSFLRAGAAAPRAIGGDIWIVPRGVPCFDFPDSLDEDYAATLLRYFPEARLRRVLFGFAPWRSPAGNRSNVALIGVDRAGVTDTGFIADQSDLARLGLNAKPGNDASIAGVSFHHEATTGALATFLGAPYLIADFESARSALRAPPSSASYIVIDLPGGLPHNLAEIKRRAAAAFPETEVLTADEFAQQSSLYWQAKTGAGAAILLAAILAMVLMGLLLVNAIGRFVQRHDRDLVSLLGHGADAGDLRAILVLVALGIFALTGVLSLVLTPVAGVIATPLLPWVTFVASDMIVPLGGMALCLVAAVFSARRQLAGHSPDVMFRS